MAGVPGSDGVEVPPLPVELAELVAELEAEPDPVEVACPQATSVSAQASATQQARSRRTATEQTILQPLPGVDFKFARAAQSCIDGRGSAAIPATPLSRDHASDMT